MRRQIFKPQTKNKIIMSLVKNHLLFNIHYLFIACFLLLTGGCYQEVASPIAAGFSIKYRDNDQSVPIIVQITNTTQGAETYEWTFEGGQPSTSTQKNPGEITYATPGDYKIKLKASNKDGTTATYEVTVKAFTGIDIQYATEIINSNYPPVEVKITNTTQGSNLTYTWTFQGGIPATFVGQDPPNVVFSSPGDHQIAVKVDNGFESFTKSTTINVLPDRVVDFNWSVNFDDQDYQVPVTIKMNNLSVSATSYQWSFAGGNPSTSTAQNPTVTYSTAGTYTITLKAINDKGSTSISKQVTILPDTNLRVFSNIKFGINAAHNANTVGAFFSTQTGLSYSANQVPTDGSGIDLAFFGLNNSFASNKFVAPNEVASFGFLSIPNARHTKFINSQEICVCGNFTASQFTAMVDDTPLRTLSITESARGLQAFNSIVPRVVLFQTVDGRKGAILVKKVVNDGLNSYILTDIKVQKQP